MFIIGGSAAFGFPYRYADTFSGMLDHGSSPTTACRSSTPPRSDGPAENWPPWSTRLVRFYRPSAIVLMVGNNEWFHWQPVFATRTPNGATSDGTPRPRGKNSARPASTILKTLAHSRALAAIEYGLVKWMICQPPGPAGRGPRLGQEHGTSFESHHELTGSGYAVAMPLSPRPVRSVRVAGRPPRTTSTPSEPTSGR